jgi:hypothetical protein
MRINKMKKDIAIFTLDETNNWRFIENKISKKTRLNLLGPSNTKLLCIALGDYLREVKGPVTNGYGLSKFKYTLTEKDVSIVSKSLIYDLMKMELF